jgi:small ubiquitin-related modifier
MSAENEEKDQNQERPQHLNLKVKAQDGTEVYFKVKKTTKLKKLMNAYCNRVGKDIGSIRFLFDGERIEPESTPAEMGMEDEDVIDAMVEQHGGCH